MIYETTVADLSPAQLFGLIVSAFFWVGLLVFAFQQYPKIHGGGRVMLWFAFAVFGALPIWLALTALAPSGP